MKDLSIFLVDCRFAVVEDMPIYWANIMSDVVYESGSSDGSQQHS